MDSIGTANGFVAVIGTNTDFSRIPGGIRLAGGVRAQADYVQLPPGLVTSLTNVTIEIWATPRAGQTWSRLFDFGTGTSTTGTFYLSLCRGGTSLNQQRFEFGNQPLWQADTAIATTVSNEYHYAVTWSPTGGRNGGGSAQWYRDAVLITNVDTGPYTITNIMDTVLWLGRSQFAADNSATADYNELRIYSHALSATEIYISHTNGPDNLLVPPQSASNLSLAPGTNAGVLTLTWTPGLGSGGSLVVMSPVQAPIGQPTNGVSYSASASFGSGQNLGTSNFVVFSASGSTVSVSNLTPGLRYYAAVYAYSGNGASRIYKLGDAPAGNALAPGTAQSISLSVPAQMLIGGTAQATVTANFGGGVFSDVTGSASYTSSATNVLTVSVSGSLQAVGYGTALVTASYQGKQDSNTITVINPLTNNLTHRYNFQIDASDLVGNADGTLLGGAAISGGQLVLNGAGAYVALPPDLFSNYTALTIEAWVTDNGSGTWSRIFDFGSGTVRNMFLTYATPTVLRAAFTVNGGGAEQRVDAVRPAAGQQTHIVLTTDGASQTARLYTNGVLAASKVGFTLRPLDVGTTPNDYLGRSQYAADPYYNGSIDEFRIYDVALPPSLILSNFQNGPDGLPVPAPVANDDSMTMNPGAMALIPVLQNDRGALIDSNSVTIVSGPSAGTAQVQAGGKVLYTHNGGTATSDQFKYQIQNLLGATSGVATVSLTISSALRLPNTTITVPNVAPPVGYQLVEAFPSLTITQALALRTPVAYSNLLFFVERRGFISYLNLTSSAPSRQLFLDLSDQVSFDNTAEGEMGLESMDFHPGFATNGYLYVTYIATGGNPYRERLARFTANPATLSVNTNTQTILWDTTKREFNHNAGDLHFGNDGYLYVSMGDEGNQYNVHTNAQRLDLSFYSGILRLDVDKKPGSLEPKSPATGTTVVLTIPTDINGKAFYSVPADNPFVGASNLYGVPVDTNHLRAEFHAIGFRHPWRFSVDPQTGEIWVGHVGQDLYESVDVLVPGGNYGWPYYEASSHLTVPLYGGAPGHPGLTNPPAGFVVSPAVWEYPHSSVAGSDPNFNGLDVIGGVVYHGSAIPELTNAYVFGDFDIGGNIWALHRNTNSTVTVERITGQFGVGAYGTDPRNGDILMANYIQNKIYRLIRTDSANSTFPQKLSDTGIFAELSTLTPNPGIVNYEPIIAFWSDYAIKRRWFCIPDLTNTMTHVTDGNWTFPTGMKWIKHFDLETQRGVPATKKRIETRVLTKTQTGVFGVSYQWNDAQTEAYLAPDGGTNFYVAVQDGTNNFQQQWEIPSRAACQACHTPVAGFALSFNTRELNQNTNMNAYSGNQLSLLNQAGYFNSPPRNPYTLPAFARGTDANYSLEYRVRSYLSENCIQCHQPGGAGAPTWDARPWLTMAQTHLLNGTLDNNGGDPLNKLIVAGDTNHSVLLRRIEGYGFSRMPPLATHQLDLRAIDLLTKWITTELTNRQDFAQWQVAWFGSTNAPPAAPNADPDQDGANNYYEYLTMTSPLMNSPLWRIGLSTTSNTVTVNFLRLANRGFLVQSSADLLSWSPWNVPGNQIFFGASNAMMSVTGPLLPANQFFRVQIFEP